MLLSAKLYRSTTRPFKTFPNGRIGETTNPLLPSEAKSKKEPEAEGRGSPPQLEVNTSNLKFRRSKKNANECESSQPDLSARGSEDVEGAELTRLLLSGSRKSDFERWLESSSSIRASMEESCHLAEAEKACHDSVISSCNASDCSEEEDCKAPEDKTTTATTNNEEEEEEEEDHVDRERRSVTASSSGIASDSEGSSLSCVSPSTECPPPNALTLQETLDVKISDLASSQGDYDPVFADAEPEVQFQLVQSKKKKTKPKTNSSDSKDDVKMKTSNDISNNQSVISKHGKKKKRNNNDNKNGSDSLASSDRSSDVSGPSLCESRRNSSPKSGRGVIPKTNSTDASFATRCPTQPRGARPPSAPGKPGRCDQGAEAISKESEAFSAATGKGAAAPINSKVPLPELKTSESQTISPIGANLPTARGFDARTEKTQSRKKGGEDVSFGSGSKDLDEFGSSVASSSSVDEKKTKKKKEKKEEVKVEQVSQSPRKPSNRKLFDLKQAQQYLLQAFNAAIKQKIKDSNSVFIYS